MRDIPAYVAAVLKTIEDGGCEAVLVGGCVRDALLGRPIHDWDIATSAAAENVAALFPKTVLTGARFGTVTVVAGEGNVEVTTYRSDGVYSDNRRPDSVQFVGSLYEDLRRRDFTMNAIAMRPGGALADPFGGQGDIGRRLIRCVGNAEDRFSEDALRMFRALRFSAQLGFEIEKNTMAALIKCAPLCRALSAERVRDETEKILLSKSPELIGTALGCGLYAGRLDGGGVTGETASSAAPLTDALRRLAGLPEDRPLRWAALAAVLLRAGHITSAGTFLSGMRLDNGTVRSAVAGAEAAPAGPLPEDRTGLKRLMAALGAEAALCAAASYEALGTAGALARVRDVLESGECVSLAGLAVTGQDLLDLGFTQGTALGAALKKLLDHVLVHPEDNRKEELIRIAQDMRKSM
jgi:tRNA nucleotidyltransferase (CCA-adding enzyme)